MKMLDENLVLFFGAGVSIPSGLPSALELTDRILKASAAMPKLQILLKAIADLDADDIKRQGPYAHATGIAASGALLRGPQTNYEQIFFLCHQISLWAEGLADHAMITPFMEKLASIVGPALNGLSLEEKLLDLAAEGSGLCDYIEDTIVIALKAPYKNGFEPLKQIYETRRFKKMQVFTLNHDILLEEFLKLQKIRFTDGFTNHDGDVRWFDHRSLESSKAKVEVLKLHGAINWFRVWGDTKSDIAVLDNSRTNHVSGKTGVSFQVPSGRPQFLTGRDKSMLYHYSIYNELFFHFNRSLRRSSRLVMSGYSWGDSSLNSLFDAWLENSKQNRMIILHSNIDEIRERPSILAQSFDARAKSGQIVVISKWFSETDSSELIAAMN
jgi:SIR2-like domain